MIEEHGAPSVIGSTSLESSWEVDTILGGEISMGVNANGGWANDQD